MLFGMIVGWDVRILFFEKDSTLVPDPALGSWFLFEGQGARWQRSIYWTPLSFNIDPILIFIGSWCIHFHNKTACDVKDFTSSATSQDADDKLIFADDIGICNCGAVTFTQYNPIIDCSLQVGIRQKRPIHFHKIILKCRSCLLLNPR